MGQTIGISGFGIFLFATAYLVSLPVTAEKGIYLGMFLLVVGMVALFLGLGMQLTVPV